MKKSREQRLKDHASHSVLADVNGSTFEPLTNCPKCGSDEVYQYTKDKDKCHNCNHIWYLYAPFKGV